MNIQRIGILKRFIASLIILESLVLAFFMRPIQDDYFNLESVQQMGVLGYLGDTWNSHGGNMVQFFLHCILILPTTTSFTYWNLGLFFLLTEVLVFFVVRLIIEWLFDQEAAAYRFWIPLLSVAGFEGLFVPGFLGAFGFSLATLAHLWPVLAFCFAVIGLKEFRGSWILALLLGMIAGNSNLGESAFACGVLVLLFACYKFWPEKTRALELIRGVNLIFLSLGTLLGTVGIAAAPGFWNRASDQVGLPHSLTEFARRFLKSLASFTADGLTHPMVWVFLFLGIYLVKTGKVTPTQVFLIKCKVLLIALTTIWASLILGSTFAYPAWHQSMGMYVLLLPASFAGGVWFGSKRSLSFIKPLLVFSSVLMLLVFMRIGVMGVHRSLVWDENLPKNICLLENDPQAKLQGAEIQYSPFGLGVDDVNTWEWMRSKYAGWVLAIPSKTKCG